MKFISLILLSIALVVPTIAQTATNTVVIDGKTYVLQTEVPNGVQQATNALSTVASVAGRTDAGNMGAGVGEAIGATLTGLVNQMSDSVGGAVDKGSDIAGAALDRTFGKDKTVVEGLDELGKTRVGMFAMAVTGWKVLGKEAEGLLKMVTGFAVGVPAQLFLIWAYIYVLRRFFITRSIPIKKTGSIFSGNRVVEYGLTNVILGRHDDAPKEAKVISRITPDERHFGLFASSAIFLIASAINFGSVIF